MSGGIPKQKRCRAPLAAAFALANHHIQFHLRVMPASAIPWPHAPTHQLSRQGTYFVTARTYKSEHHFRGAQRLAVLHRGLVRLAHDFGWQLEAWAVFSNHYHFVAHSPVGELDASSLRVMLSLLHEKTAKWVNRLDGAPGRKVWFNYRETRLTCQKSYLARLHYTHQNAVKHGLVAAAHLYPWCSASWFERTASPAQVRAICRFRTDQMKLDDEMEVAPEW
jgi:REP-associated tyrosine transposase